MPQHYNVYIADDGTEFSSSIDCENYEEGQKKIVVEGVIWYDQEGNVLPLILASWKKVVAIHFENDDADYDLYHFLEASEYEVSTSEQIKFFAFGKSPIDPSSEPYLLLYNGETEVWENVAEKYAYIKKWLDKI